MIEDLTMQDLFLGLKDRLKAPVSEEIRIHRLKQEMRRISTLEREKAKREKTYRKKIPASPPERNCWVCMKTFKPNNWLQKACGKACYTFSRTKAFRDLHIDRDRK